MLSKRQSTGVSNASCDWFGSYLSQRSQVVNVVNSVSDPLLVTVGVPQGSIPGSVLFSLCVNDLLLVPILATTQWVMWKMQKLSSAFPQIIFQTRSLPSFLTLKLLGKEIKPVPVAKDLGVIIDSSLC